MAEPNLDRLESRLDDLIVETVEIPIRTARYAMAERGIIADWDTLVRRGGELLKALYASGFSPDGKLDPEMMTQMLGEGLFLNRIQSIYQRYGGQSGAANIAETGEEGGMQSVFDRVTESVVEEFIRGVTAAIFREEVDESNPRQIEAIVRQLQNKEGLENVPMFELMVSWKELVLYRVQRKKALKLRYGRRIKDQKDNF